MPVLFGHLVYIYSSWQQNGIILSSVTQGVVTLTRKDLNNGKHIKHISNFRPIIVLNVEFLAEVLVKRLALVVEKRIWKVQRCAIPDRSIQHNLPLIQEGR